MSELRKQLQQARAGYDHLKYPGNLAADVLPPAGAPNSWRWKLVVGALAAAAAVVVLVWPQPGAVDSSGTVAHNDDPALIDLDDSTTEAADETHSLSLVVDEIPTLPEIGPFWSDSQNESGEFEQLVPSFPSLTELTAAEASQSSEETSKENSQ